MAIVSDIQFADSAVKPPAFDITCSFLAASFTASTSLAVGSAGLVPCGLFHAKSGNNVEAYFETTNADGTASIFLNNDASPKWEMAVSGNLSDSLVISNCTGINNTEHYKALSITPAGAIGIGKTSAASVLDVEYANSATGGIILTETTNSITTKIVNEGSSGSVGTTTSHPLGFRTVGLTRAVIDTSGRVGIGTITPTASSLLDVRGAAIFNEDGDDVDFRIEGDDDANLFFVNAGDDEIGIGTQTADGLVHIHAGTAGTVAADSTACNLVIENSTAGGVSILTPNASAASLAFGSPADAIGAEIKHTQSSTTMEVGTKESGGILKLNSADGTNAVYIDASQNVGIGTAVPGVPLRVQGNACFTGTVTVAQLSGGGASLWSSGTNIIYTTGNCVGIGTATPDNTLHVYTGTPGTSPAAVSTDHDDIVVEVAASGGLTIQVPDTGIAAIALGSCSSSSPAQLAWDYDGNTNGLLTLGTNQNSADLRFMSTNCTETMRLTNACVGIGTTTPAAQVELKKDQNATTTLLVSNATSGTAGAATLQLGANANAVKLQALSSAFTTSNAAIADGVLLESASTASGGLHLSAASTNELALWTNNTRRVTITSAGCVGIGTATTSDVIFKIQGDGCTTGTFYANAFSGGGVTDNVWIMSGQDAYFKELDAGDNIGIGTTTPAHTLHVGGNAASAPALLVCDSGGQRIEVNSGAVKINNAYTMPAADGSAGEVICTDGSDTLTFGPGGYWTCVSGPELYYTGGNVGIGTADPSHTLDVEGVANFLTCTVTPVVCATTNIETPSVCSTSASFFDRVCATSCAASPIVCGTTCIASPQVCGSTQVIGAIVCSAADVCAAQCVIAGACVEAPTVCATTNMSAAAGTVQSAPSGNSDITPKCYVDNEIAAAGSTTSAVCCCCMSGTWTVPTGVDWVWLTMMPGGTSGAGGGTGSGSVRGGGGGGSAGSGLLNRQIFLQGCTAMPMCAPPGGAAVAAGAQGSCYPLTTAFGFVQLSDQTSARAGAGSASCGQAANVHFSRALYLDGNTESNGWSGASDCNNGAYWGASRFDWFMAPGMGGAGGGGGAGTNNCGSNGGAGFHASPWRHTAWSAPGGTGGACQCWCYGGGGGGGGGGSWLSQAGGAGGNGNTGNSSPAGSAGGTGGVYGAGGGGGGGGTTSGSTGYGGGAGGPGAVIVKWIG